MLKQTVVFYAALALVSTYTVLLELQPIPEKFKGQRGCYVGALDGVLPFGKTTPSAARCLEYRCTKHHLEILGCTKVESDFITGVV